MSKHTALARARRDLVELDVTQTALPNGTDDSAAPAPIQHVAAARSALVVRSGEHAGRVFEIAPEGSIIGRSSRAAIRMPDWGVSRLHAKIRLLGEGAEIQDIASVNGTFLNDVRIVRPTALQAGDRVRVGRTVFEYLVDTSEATPSDNRYEPSGECVALFPSRQRRVACSIYRGGTSKAVLFHEDCMPRDPSERDRLILDAFGSPDTRQIDGLGGADPLTSKVGFVGPPSVPNADIDYTFGYVGITSEVIDYTGSCGNTAAAVGPFALDQGLIEAHGPTTRVRIHNTNTGKIIACEFPTPNGEFVCDGDFKIDGVPGTGSKILLDFAETVGSRTGKLLPTGNVRDELTIPSLGTIVVTMVDVSNPFVFVRGEDLGVTGDETIEDFSANRAVLERCELIRAYAAERMGLACAKTATAKSPATPKIAVVSRPVAYESTRQHRRAEDAVTAPSRKVEASEVDIIARMTALQRLHKTFAVTGAVCLGVAAKIPGTLVNEIYRAAQPTETPVVRIGHPSGTIQVEIDLSMDGGRFVLSRACLVRTARLIMDGHVRVGGVGVRGI